MVRKSMLMAVMLLAIQVLAQPEGEVFTSERGLFRVAYESQLVPIAINRMHSWTLSVTDQDGAPVTGAEIAIKGGMPQHNHGLATAPTIEPAGEGRYLLQGLRFHMMGYWELELTIDDGNAKDSVVIALTL